MSSTIAYFSMEIALRSDIPTYSGGLGVLAGDTIRSAADLKLPMSAVTLLYRKGYFSQTLDGDGWQKESPTEWRPEDHLMELPVRVSVTLAGRTVKIRAWHFEVTGHTGSAISVFLLDTDLPENDPADRAITHTLYGGDARYRLLQEAVLGIGGVRILRALGHHDIHRFHMNEGHAALLALELLDERARAEGRQIFNGDDIAAIRKQCLFTTHTPVPAGHDQFPMALVTEVLGTRPEFSTGPSIFGENGSLDMTHLALTISHYVNGVAQRHGEVSRLMFKRAGIDVVTNGVHPVTWTSPSFQAVFDRHIPSWREESFSLRHALSIPGQEVWQAHEESKKRLLERVKKQTGVAMDPKTLTLGFARRATPYKRADLFFHDMARLRRLVSGPGKVQVIYAGKAHPSDKAGKELIHRIVEAGKALGSALRVVYLPGYDMDLGLLITSGVDVWLNTPQPPLEASGTSGMKAAVNGVPSLSVLDGWWVEGHIENVTGWAFGEESGADPDAPRDAAKDAASLYDKLEQVVLPCFYQSRGKFTDIMRHAIALNGSFFNTQRMVQEYVVEAYFP